VHYEYGYYNYNKIFNISWINCDFEFGLSISLTLLLFYLNDLTLAKCSLTLCVV